MTGTDIDTLQRLPPLAVEDKWRRGSELERDGAADLDGPASDVGASPLERGGAARATAAVEGAPPARWHSTAIDHARMELAEKLSVEVAHRFNNVLQAALGGLDLAIGELAARPEVLGNLKAAKQAGQQGTRLIGELLSLAGRQALRPAALKLPLLLEGLARTFGHMFGRDIRVSVEVPPDLPAVFADAAHLETALLNVALNAREAMTEGGELWIEARAEGDRIAVVLSDNGGGMSPNTLARACEPFYSTKNVAGSGLGLSVVQGFARQSGGELRIQSVHGAGTRVELLLPAAATSRPLRERSSRRGRVLVVDDQPEVRRVTAAFLSKAGHTVIQAGNASDVLDGVLLFGPPFDVLVTDYAMPGIDGVEMILQIREVLPTMPAVLITGHTGFLELQERWEGMRDLGHLPADVAMLRKPFPLSHLVREVERLLAGVGEEQPSEAGPVTPAG